MKPVRSFVTSIILVSILSGLVCALGNADDCLKNWTQE